MDRNGTINTMYQISENTYEGMYKIIKENYDDLKQLYVFEIQENEKLKKIIKRKENEEMKVRVCNFSDVFKSNREEDQRLYQIYFFQYVKNGEVKNEYFAAEEGRYETGEYADVRKNHITGKWFSPIENEKEHN